MSYRSLRSNDSETVGRMAFQRHDEPEIDGRSTTTNVARMNLLDSRPDIPREFKSLCLLLGEIQLIVHRASVLTRSNEPC